MAKQVVTKKTVKVYDPNGGEHVMSLENARDKVNIDKWSYANKAKIVNPADIDTTVTETTITLPNEVTPNIIGNDPAEVEATELDMLRIEAAKLGIDVKPNWGKAKIEKAIAAAGTAA